MKNLTSFKEFINESFDADYWAAYNDTKGRPGSQPLLHHKERKDFNNVVRDAIDDWNNEADEGQGTSVREEKEIKELARKFYSDKGWISIAVVQAMIMQN